MRWDDEDDTPMMGPSCRYPRRRESVFTKLRRWWQAMAVLFFLLLLATSCADAAPRPRGYAEVRPFYGCYEVMHVLRPLTGAVVFGLTFGVVIVGYWLVGGHAKDTGNGV